MALNRQAVTFFNFSGGLNTEASVVNIGPTDATDILNITLNQDGSLERRPSIDFIAEKVGGGYYQQGFGDYSAYDPVISVGTFALTNKLGKKKEYVATLVGAQIKVYDYVVFKSLGSVDAPAYTYSLAPYSGSEVGLFKTQFLKTRNRVYIINKDCQLTYLEYDEADELVLKPSDVFFRDIDGSSDSPSDSYVNDKAGHNAYWEEGNSTYGDKNYVCIKAHLPDETNRPGSGVNWQDYWVVNGAADPNYKGWISGVNNGFRTHDGKTYKISTTHYSAPEYEPGVGANWREMWELIDDTALAGIEPWALRDGTNYIKYYHQKEKYKENVVHTSNVEKVTFTGTRKGWKCGALAAGRMWLAGVNNDPNKIYFSQTINEDIHATRMYQFADPYNVHDSDTVATDGGTIVISDADEIITIETFRGGVLVFATNGVWHVSGKDGSFTADNFSIDKISDDGIAGRSCAVSVESSVVYFGLSGVYVISLVDDYSAPTVQSMSSEKLDSFYNRIPLFNKAAGKAIVNASEKRMYFFTNFESKGWTTTRNKFNANTHCRDALIYDFKLNAWTKLSLKDDPTGELVSVADIFTVQGSSLDYSNVIDNSGNQIVSESSANVIASGIDETTTAEQLTVAVVAKVGDDSRVYYAFAHVGSNTLKDFSKVPEDAEEYPCYVETAFQIFGDIQHKMQHPYITTLFERTEIGQLNEEGIDVNAGGCLMTVMWDWSNSVKSAKYGKKRQAYLPNKWNLAFENGADNGVPVVKSKHKIRGRGSSVQLRFENDGSKPFKLYGWQMDVTSTTKV